MYNFDDGDPVGLIDDFTDTIEIENFSRPPQKKKSISFAENDSENVLIEINKTSCCFYKYLHNLPHEHSVTSRAIQCDISKLRNFNKKFNSNNHNMQQLTENNTEKSIEIGLQDISSNKSFLFSNNSFQNNGPPLLRESQKFRKGAEEPISAYLNQPKNHESYLISDNIETDNPTQISVENSDFFPCNNIIKVEPFCGHKNQNNVDENNLNEIKNKIFSEHFLENRNLSNGIDPSTIILPVEDTSKKMNTKIIQNDLLNQKVTKPKTAHSKCLKNNCHIGNINRFCLSEPFESRNQVRGKYCSVRCVQHKFFLTESANIENIIQDPSDRRIKAVCDRYNCNIEVYSKVVKSGYRKNIIVISAPNHDYLGKCVRSLDHNMNWCLSCQLKN